MHPTDHISTALLYYVLPNNISGALYHLVATYSVNTGAEPIKFEEVDQIINFWL